MNRRLAALEERLTDAARGLGFDARLEKPLDEVRRLGLALRQGSDGDALTVLRLEVVVAPLDAPALRIVRNTLGAAFRSLLGLTRTIATEDAALDALALVETRETVRARGAIQGGLGAVARELLSEHPDAVLEARTGLLAIRFEARDGCLERALDLATRAARALEATRIRPVERDAAVRCGFCHADIAPAEDHVVRCDRCAATVHAGCWQDHDGCPALGCAGAAR